MSARACICRWPPCFSRPIGSILGVLYGTALASPHRSGPSKLPGHVSLRRFETAKLPGHVSFASRLWPATASLPHSSLPRCTEKPCGHAHATRSVPKTINRGRRHQGVSPFIKKAGSYGCWLIPKKIWLKYSY